MEDFTIDDLKQLLDAPILIVIFLLILIAHVVSSHSPQVSPATVRRCGRAGARHRDARQCHRAKPHRARLPVLRPRGTGKTTIARIFAKCLNCTGGPKVDFDDNDDRVKEITEGRALDVMEIDGASNNGVEQVRELRETCQYVPASGKFKIYIIDEVHMLSTAAFNALLKTLEEPPAHVKFMFATTDPEKVLATILSRCQRFDLRRIPTALIVKHLALIAGKEKVKIDDAALYAIARGADGGMRDAESTLDQLISFCGDKIEEPDVLTMFGLTAQGKSLASAAPCSMEKFTPRSIN